MANSLLKLMAAILAFGLAAGIPPAEAAETAATKVCTTCGTVKDIRVHEQEGEGTGLGAVTGGVAGAVVGRQIGQGRGRDLATIAGAAGGAYAGHQIEKKVKKTKRYEVVVRMDDDTTRIVTQTEEPPFAIGDKVRIVDGRLQPR